MSQNRFLLPNASSGGSGAKAATGSGSASQDQDLFEQENQLSVDTDFDSYWEEEARNPHRNRIRIGRQYQATVPPLLKPGEKDLRKLEDLETLSFCPKKSARVSDSELDHYFTVAKSLNLFASLVETRSLLGRDVTIADLNHIRQKEGLSLASVIQPPPVRGQQINYSSNPNISPSSSSANTNPSTTIQHQQLQSPSKSPQNNQSATTLQQITSSSLSSSPRENQIPIDQAVYTFNQPLMKALSHFISLHHPCHHDKECKKLLKEVPLDDNSAPTVSMPAGNLRQGTSNAFQFVKDPKPGRSRSSLKQASMTKIEEPESHVRSNDLQQSDENPGTSNSGESIQSPSHDDWTREEVELFSKAIEVCGKNFGSIRKEFLPSKSVRSIVEYYYIGSRDVSDSKKKSNQNIETANDVCSSPEKSLANNNGQGGSGGNGSSGSSNSGGPSTGGKSTYNPSSTVASGSNSNTSSGANNTTSANSSSRTSTSACSSNQLKADQNPSLSNQNSMSANSSKHLDKIPFNPVSQISPDNRATKNSDPRMSVYNFDDDFKDESPVKFECPRPGSEVKPLKAKPILPDTSTESDPTKSNVGSLKFFMDGQLILKLNACQDQQEGDEKCHWVQSGEKNYSHLTKHKRYTKRASDRDNESQSNSVISSYQDDDSKNGDLTGDDDSKESMSSSFTTSSPSLHLAAHQKAPSNSGSPNAKRPKMKSEQPSPQSQQLHIQPHHNQQPQQQQQQGHQLHSPIDYNRLAVNNRMKERNDPIASSPVIGQAMPWLNANSFAVAAAALLGGLPFPAPNQNPIMTNDNMMAPGTADNSHFNIQTSKPMDLSLEHTSAKPMQKPSSRSRSKPKNN